VAGALTRPVLEEASKAGIPVWLKTMTLHSRDVHGLLGFGVIEEMRIGKGKADE
jgi:hypothetical protein